MFYENEVCPGCGQKLSDGDDIVVCPVCATPQHRTCWQKNNNCVNHTLHGGDFVWQAQNPPPPSEPEGKQQQTCPFCSSPCDIDALHCENCGAPLGKQVTPQEFVREAYSVNADEIIGDESAADIAMYVRSNVGRYLPKFRRFSQGGSSFSWNWAAFFFAPYWFFYRRLYKWGVFFVAIFATITLVTAVPLTSFTDTYEQYYNEIISEETTDERYAQIEAELLQAMKPAYTVLGLNIAMRAVCALFANKAYYKKMLADLKNLHQTSPDSEMFQYLLLRNGGTSSIGFALGFFGYEALYQAMLYFSDKI